jgi:hypothetical protein
VLRHDGKIKMPPSGKLKADEIAAITAWVGMGAPWPEAPLSEAAVKEAATGAYAITEGQRKFWSFRPVRTPPLPPVKDRSWAAGSAIDRFILARLEKEGLKPAPPADRRTLIRRATFDLHGLPPTPAEVDAFLADRSPDAWAKVVDRLLASPRYGERWARHWLDVARYADTKGYVFEEDRRYPHAYNYRDWVVRAFNEDLPYDRFVTEQLAADRLPLGDDKRPLAALGFLTVGRRFLNNPHDIIDDRIDVVTRGFLGLTVSCARCHNHKFDPIPTADYYSLYGVFASSVEPAPQIIAPKAVADPWRAHDAKVQAAVSEEQELVMAQVKRLRERLAKGETLPDPVKDGLQNTREEMRPRDNVLPTLEAAFEAGVPDRLKTLRDSLASLRKTYPPAPERAMTLEDAPQPMTPRIFRRGNPGNPGDEVPRRFLQVLASNGGERTEWKNGSGRLELARAIASKNNPLTARVFVNRVWMQHFGAALVRTPSDFGLQGERPTHPDLLDHLAATFMESGWRVKNLHRRILLSNTYRQSSNTSEKSFRRDPENRLVGRMNRRRLEYEALRDSLLWASGRLDTNKIGGPAEDLWKAPFPTRRTLYGFIDRQNLPGVFRTFDFASPDASSPQRFRTTVPQQALFLLNSPFAAEQARFLARRPEVAKKPDDAARVRTLYRLLFHRAPDADEMAVALRFVKSASGASAGAATDVAAADPWRHGYGAFDAATGRVTVVHAAAVLERRALAGERGVPGPQTPFRDADGDRRASGRRREARGDPPLDGAARRRRFGPRHDRPRARRGRRRRRRGPDRVESRRLARGLGRGAGEGRYRPRQRRGAQGRDPGLRGVAAGEPQLRFVHLGAGHHARRRRQSRLGRRRAVLGSRTAGRHSPHGLGAVRPGAPDDQRVHVRGLTKGFRCPVTTTARASRTGS